MLAYNPSANPLNTNEWAFPLCECIHIASFALSIGTIGFVDLSLLGVNLVDRSPAELLRSTQPWTLGGICLVIVSGLLIFSSDPVMYLHNDAFRLKILALLLAILFHYFVYRRTVLNGAGIRLFAAGIVSLLLWSSTILGGVFIAFY